MATRVPRVERTVWVIFLLWIAHNLEEALFDLPGWLRSTGHFWGLYVGTPYVGQAVSAVMQLASLLALKALLIRPARGSRFALAALVFLIPIGAVHHVACWMPGVYTAVLFGLPSGFWFARQALRRRWLAGRWLLVAFLASAAAYLPFTLGMTALGLGFERFARIGSVEEAWAYHAISTAVAICAALAALRRGGAPRGRIAYLAPPPASSAAANAASSKPIAPSA